MINPDRLTVKSAEALNDAVSAARQAGNPVVYDLHLLLALLNQDEGIVVPVLQKLGVSVASTRQNAGRFAKPPAPRPPRVGGTKAPAATMAEEVTFAFVSFTLVSDSHGVAARACNWKAIAIRPAP